MQTCRLLSIVFCVVWIHEPLAAQGQDSGLPDIVEQRCTLFGRDFVRNPINALAMVGAVGVEFAILRESPPVYPSKSNPRKNTPWTPDEWAAFSTTNLRNPTRIAEFGSSLFLGFKDDFAFAKARIVCSSSCFFVASPVKMDPRSSTAARFDPEVIWSLCRTGDKLMVETPVGGLHAVRLYRVDRDNDAAEIIDMWPRRFVFKDAETRSIADGATIVIVPKRKLLAALRQLIFLEERAFLVQLLTAAADTMAADDLAAIASAFALQLAAAGELADLDTALNLIQIAEQGKPNLDPKLANRFAFTKVYCQLLRRAITSEILTGASIADAATREHFKLRLAVDNRALADGKHEQYLKDATTEQLVRLAKLQIPFDPIAAQRIFEIAETKQSGSVEDVEAIIGTAICAIMLGDLRKAADAADRAKSKLDEEWTRYRDTMKSNGLAPLLDDEEKRRTMQLFFAVRPDLELKRRRIELARSELKQIKYALTSPATKIRLGELSK